MRTEKTNISARVEITLKKIVEESSFTHKDAYELGAMIIAIGDAVELLWRIVRYPTFFIKKLHINSTQYILAINSYF